MIVEIVGLEVRTGPGLMSSVLTSVSPRYIASPPSDNKVWKWLALVTNGGGDLISDTDLSLLTQQCQV